MSHNIKHIDYPENVNKKIVKAGWDEFVRHADWQEGSSGLPGEIRWIDHICSSREEAEDYIEAHDKGWYDQLAVKYKEYSKLELSKTYEILKERADRLKARYVELNEKIHYKGVKSKFITCRTCESKISTEILSSEKNISTWKNRNICPICGADIRPESTLDIIAKAKANAIKAAKDLQIEEKKLQAKQEKKAQIRWLLKIEYHT